MSKGTKGDNAKKYLIEVAAKLFLERGYSNTGINDILTKASMSKGSFYFHFSSKKELAIEVAKYYEEKLLKKWLKPLSNNVWSVFVNKMILDIKELVESGNYFGCPLAVLGMEVAFIEDDLSDIYSYGINELIDVFSNSLQASGMPEDKIFASARKAFAIYEGYLIYYRISKDSSVFDAMLKDLLEIYK